MDVIEDIASSVFAVNDPDGPMRHRCPCNVGITHPHTEENKIRVAAGINVRNWCSGKGLLDRTKA